MIPDDDQIYVLHHLQQQRPDSLEDFAATLDRRQAWTSPVGRFLAWLLCGHNGIHRHYSPEILEPDVR